MALTMHDAATVRSILTLALDLDECSPALAKRGEEVVAKIEREAQGRKNIAHMKREEREEDLGFSEASRRHGERVAARCRDNRFANLGG